MGGSDIDRWLAILIALPTLLLALTPSGPAKGAGPPGEPFRVGLDARDVGSLDPAFTRGSVDEFIVRQIFNTLLSPPMGSAEVDLSRAQGELAERWTVSEGGKIWTFLLRKSVLWQKGYGEVTADDVKFTFDRLRDPKLASPYAGAYTIIDEVKAVDRHTVQFVLKRPNLSFHATSLMPRFGGYIVSRKAVEALGKDFGLTPVGSGAFQFEAFEPKARVTVVANKNYFRGAPGIERAEFLLMPETSARTLAYLKGDLKIAEGARTSGWPESLRRRKPDAILDILRPGSTQTLFLNMGVKPFDDLRVRQAISYGLNRRTWQRTFGMLSFPMPGPAPEEFYGALTAKDVPPALQYPYDPRRARALLAQAGYPNGVAVKVFISEREDYLTNMLLIKDQLRKIGMTVDLRVVDHTTYMADISKDLDPMVVYSTSQPPVVISVLQTFYAASAIVTRPGGNRNYSHYGEMGTSIDDRLVAAIGETDRGKQLKTLHEIQLQILRDLPAVPLQNLAFLYVRQPGVDLGFEVKGGLGHYQLEKVRIVERR